MIPIRTTWGPIQMCVHIKITAIKPYYKAIYGREFNVDTHFLLLYGHVIIPPAFMPTGI